MKYLPLLMTWQLWITLNRVIFDNCRPSVQQSIQLHRYEVKDAISSKRRFIGLEPVYEFLVEFFDGASAKKIGGVGVHIILSKEHHFHLKLGCGQSTNTRFELLAPQVLLVFAKQIGLPYLHIRGDSSTVINWFNGKASLETLELTGWCQEIMTLRSCFSHLETTHVYREFNVQADLLSNEELLLSSGILYFLEFIEEVCHWHGNIQLI